MSGEQTKTVTLTVEEWGAILGAIPLAADIAERSEDAKEIDALYNKIGEQVYGADWR